MSEERQQTKLMLGTSSESFGGCHGYNRFRSRPAKGDLGQPICFPGLSAGSCRGGAIGVLLGTPRSCHVALLPPGPLPNIVFLSFQLHLYLKINFFGLGAIFMVLRGTLLTMLGETKDGTLVGCWKS